MTDGDVRKHLPPWWQTPGGDDEAMLGQLIALANEGRARSGNLNP